MSSLYKSTVKSMDQVRDHLESREAQGFNHYMINSVFDVHCNRVGYEIESYVSSIPNEEKRVRELEAQLKKLKESIALYKALLKEVL